MSRITIANLKAEIVDINNRLQKSGSNYSYVYNSRNNVHAVDLIATVNGSTHTINMACGYEIPRILISQLNDHFDHYLGKTFKLNQ